MADSQAVEILKDTLYRNEFLNILRWFSIAYIKLYYNMKVYEELMAQLIYEL